MFMLSRTIGPIFFGGSFLLLIILVFLVSKWKPEKEEDSKRRKVKKSIKSLLLFIIIWIVGGVAMLMNPIIMNLSRIISLLFTSSFERKFVPFVLDYYFPLIVSFFIGLLVAIKDFHKKSWLWIFLIFLVILLLFFVLSFIYSMY